MSRQRLRRAAAAVLACGAAAGSAQACELRAFEHRSGREVLRAPLAAGAAPELRVSFVHSVLATPVEDRYLWRDGAWLLVEERFQGEGYGLPHAAGPGERLERTESGWRLVLERPVVPLVVRPLLAQRMSLTLDGGRSWLLGVLTAHAVELRAEGC
ncbi:MAG: DUF1850 domain-containing protein [Rubrivivax sp.]|nr:DUF1850 domain-containing protein [Rubrivivax sp.]